MFVSTFSLYTCLGIGFYRYWYLRDIQGRIRSKNSPKFFFFFLIGYLGQFFICSTLDIFTIYFSCIPISISRYVILMIIFGFPFNVWILPIYSLIFYENGFFNDEQKYCWTNKIVLTKYQIKTNKFHRISPSLERTSVNIL